MSASVLVSSTRELRSEDGDGRENVAEKSESAFFQSSLRLVQVTTLSNVGEPPVKLNS